MFKLFQAAELGNGQGWVVARVRDNKIIIADDRFGVLASSGIAQEIADDLNEKGA